MTLKKLTEQEEQAAISELREIVEAIKDNGKEIQKHLNEALKELEYRRSLGENL